MAFILIALCIFPSVALADPCIKFFGGITGIYINNSRVLIEILGGQFYTEDSTIVDGGFDLTFNIADPASDFMFKVVEDAFLNDKNLYGSIEGCNDNKIYQLYTGEIPEDGWLSNN
ncbi:MAG: hypothetical protein QNJ64_17235 [Crocosphaera sp.]|nr:hypothetical protein [Crocosphaera sp.]